jgi:hypothetical protein
MNSFEIKEKLRITGEVLIETGIISYCEKVPIFSKGKKISEGINPATLQWKSSPLRFKSRNTICQSGYNKINGIGWDAPVAIAFGNIFEASRTDLDVTNLKLDKELDTGKGRALTLINNRYNSATLQYTFFAFFPKNLLVSNQLLTEIGMFVGDKGESALVQKDYGALLARKFENFEKMPTDDVTVTWTIRTELN